MSVSAVTKSLAWYFTPHTSEIDWCETNYQVSPYVAEFFNTFSNIPFVLFPPLLMYLFRGFSEFVSPDFNIVMGLLIIVGIGSGYFHATLSFSGQLIDELAILWVVLAAFAIAVPDSLLRNSFFLGSRIRLRIFLAVSGVLGTLAAFINPVMNAILLQMFAIPMLYLIYIKMQKCRNWTVIRLTAAAIAWWALAVTCWINDRFFCTVWTNMLLPSGLGYLQLHSWWHLLIVLGSYLGVVLLSYFRALEAVPERRPRISYWPELSWAWEVGVPFVKLDDIVKGDLAKSE